MIDVEIRNFQSIEQLKIRIDGFTALAGRSNLGKSSIIRAIKAALVGATADPYVRHGPYCLRVVKGTKTCKCACLVHLQAEGFDLLWEKGDNVNRYEHNGQTYTAVNRGTPDFLQDTFGAVKIGEDKVLIQVADQFRHSGGGPIFLLDESGAVVADVLSDVAQLDRINVASRLADKDRREAAASRKVRERDVLELQKIVASYDGLDEVLAQAKEIEKQEQNVSAQRRRRDQLLNYRDSFLRTGRQLKFLIGLSRVTPPPEITPVLAKHQEASQLREFIASVLECESLIARLQGVEDISAPLIQPLNTSYSNVGKLQGWLAQLRVFRELFVRFKKADSVATPGITGLLEMAAKVLRLAALRGKQANVERTLTQLEQEMLVAEEEFQAVKAELGTVCPTCARPFELGLAHEHAA